jgi:hypothetical protein
MGARGIGLIVGLALGLLAAAPASGAEWLAGDGHVHTCYSHDAYCGPDDPEGQDAFYSFGGSVMQRFTEASLKGMDFLVVSDHDDIQAHTDPSFGANGVTGIRAYEASLSGGHAQMIGARVPYPEGNGNASATIAMADALRADGGTFQANHPGYRLTGAPITTCAEAGGPRMHWGYAYTVLPDTIEVWNATTLLRPSELFWECWLQRGARIPAIGGSDSHGGNHLNIGLPMTWAYAASNSEADVLAAIRAGRTTLSRVAPNQGAVRLLLKGDRDRNGSYESMVGDAVPPRTPLRVEAEGAPGTGLVTVRANGTTKFEAQPMASGAVIDFEAPAEPGWVRATMYLQNGVGAVDPSCAPPEAPPLSTCTDDLAVAAMTSPIWVSEPPAKPPPATPPGEEPGEPPEEPPPPPPKVDPPPEQPPQEKPESEEPDRQEPLPAPQQGGYQPLPEVPPQRDQPPPVSKLRATWFRAAAARHPSLRVRLRWKAAEGPFDVQVRRPGSKKWKSIASRTQERQRIVRLARGKWVLRVRAVPAFAPAGPWRSLTVRL